MTFVARSPLQDRSDDDRRAAVPPPAAPVELFEDLRNRRYLTLINAGIEDDAAWEVASFNAMETMLARLRGADDFENSPQAYGDSR